MMDSTATGAGTIRLQSFAEDTLLDYNETMDIPESSLSTKYYFPVYENKWAPLNSQVRFAHAVDGSAHARMSRGRYHRMPTPFSY